VRNFCLRDEVSSSIYQHILSYFADEKKRPRAADFDMFFVSADELIQFQYFPYQQLKRMCWDKHRVRIPETPKAEYSSS
jgi:hypothetical protein